MKYLIAPSAYKGFFSPLEVANAIADGVRKCSADNIVSLAPIADGGDGTIEAIQIATNGKLHKLEVSGPLGEPVTAFWLTLEERESTERLPTEVKTTYSYSRFNSSHDTTLSLCVLELASACGLAYIEPDHVSALDSNTVGAGQLIAHCYESGYRNIVLAVGGSASTDGGTGILTALGAKFFDVNGAQLRPGGRYLHAIQSIDLSSLAKHSDLRLRVATDVINPLLGPQGAARIFAPQKGATVAEVELLENGLSNFADVLEQTTRGSARHLQGAGAAGGVPFGLTLALDAEIIPGFEWITSLIRLEEKIKEADIVITAEGSLDSQSMSGKATGEIAQLCKTFNKHLWVVPGRVEKCINWKDYGVERVLATAADEGTYATLADIKNAALQLCSDTK